MQKHVLLIVLAYSLACCAGENLDNPSNTESPYITSAETLAATNVTITVVPVPPAPISTIAAPVATFLNPSQTQTNVSLGTSTICNYTIDFGNFTKIRDSYYLFELKQKLNWFNAAYYCRSKGAHLLTMESYEEFEAISRHSVKLERAILPGRYYFWTSGNDLGEEGVYKWVTTGKNLTLGKSSWAPQQPDNDEGDEDCINTGEKYDRFVMNDMNCFRKLNFICEFEQPTIVALNVRYSEKYGPNIYTSVLNRV